MSLLHTLQINVLLTFCHSERAAVELKHLELQLSNFQFPT